MAELPFPLQPLLISSVSAVRYTEQVGVRDMQRNSGISFPLFAKKCTDPDKNSVLE